MNKKLIRKFKEGRCTPEEIRKVLLWYQSDEAESAYSVEIEKYWQSAADLPFEEQDRVFQKILQKIDVDETPGREVAHHTLKSEKKTNGRFSPAWLVAASLTLLLLSAAGIYFSLSHRDDVRNTPFQINQITKQTEKGQKYTMRLADGTKVKLNSESKISFPEQFDGELRIVEFVGEAFFEVAKDTARPFVIRSGKISTTVLGTSFNLRATADAGKFEVAVLTGSVKVSHEAEKGIDERHVAPHQSATFDQKSNFFNIQPFDPEVVMAWVDGVIVFEDAGLDEIVGKLESWYGVDINVSAIKGRISKGYTGSYKDKSLESVLEGISFVLGFEFDINGKKVILK